MSSTKREVIEGLQSQGVDEKVVYMMTVDPAPSSVIAVTVWDEHVDEDVTEDVMPTGTAQISGSVVTLPRLLGLTEGRTYRVEVLYSDGTNELEPYFRVLCEQ